MSIAAVAPRTGALPRRELAAFDASGLLAITLPAADGGPDLPMRTLAEVVRRIAAVDPAIAQAPQAHYLMVDVLAVWGSDAQRRRLFGDVLDGAGSATRCLSAAERTRRLSGPGSPADGGRKAESTTAPEP